MTRRTLRTLPIAALLVALLSAVARADELADARGVIGKQIELIQKGDVAGLRATFTKRLHHRITEERVQALQKEAANYRVENLVASAVSEGGVIKIKMKNGGFLSRLVQVDGEWLADTLWFR